MKKINYFLSYWAPPAVWMLLIFYFSSQQRVQVTGTFLFDFLIFKGLHVIEYAFLYFLLFRGFYSLKQKYLDRKKKLVIPLLIALLYAISDEIHQTLVPTREGKFRDVFFDAFGILLMYIYSRTFSESIKKFL